ncbi:MAG: thioredoxin family protein [Flavobacteriaceae bacterium]|nr:thioredoxin family protein [Flavobacteriaceae bacterium]
MKKLLTFSFMLVCLMAFTPKTSVNGYSVGDAAEDFKLINVNGDYVSMSDFPDAKGFIVIFTCNSCPYSVMYEDRIIALDKKYKNQGFPVIAINPNDPSASPKDSFELMQVRAKEKGFTFPYLFDEGQSIYPKYGATRTPHVFLLNKESGKLIVKYIGAIDDNSKDASAVRTKFVEDAVDALLNGKDVPIKTAPAIGCTIKTVS